MLGNIRKDIERLIAAYEAENRGRRILEEELERVKTENEIYKKRITELEQETDDLKLRKAFLTATGGSDEAREIIDELIHKIDNCITLMKK